MYKSWINENKELHLKYRGNWIAYTYEDGLLAYGKTLRGMIEEAEKKKERFMTWRVSEHFGESRIISVRWKPFNFSFQ